jgi:hypothetical protein
LIETRKRTNNGYKRKIRIQTPLPHRRDTVIAKIELSTSKEMNDPIYSDSKVKKTIKVVLRN